MKTSQNALTLIKKYEGFSAKTYICPAGKTTIGYGHVLKSGEKFLRAISKQDAEEILKKDVEITETELEKLITINITQNQFDALVSLAYNIGSGNFAKSTLLKLLNTGDIKATSEQFNRWIYSNGKVLDGLKTRREEEKLLFCT